MTTAQLGKLCIRMGLSMTAATDLGLSVTPRGKRQSYWAALHLHVSWLLPDQQHSAHPNIVKLLI